MSPTPPKDYPPLVRAVSDRTRKNPRHSKVSRSTTERIMTVIAAGLPLDQVDDPAVPDDVAAVLPYGRHLVEIVVDQWRAVLAERTKVSR